jgi:ribosomal protein L7/L12
LDIDALCKKHRIDRNKIDVDRVLALLRVGSRIEAIKLVVAQSGAGLGRSKDLIDDIREQMTG